MQKLKNFLFLSCLRATEFIEKKQVLGLSPIEEMQLRIHLSMCKACFSFEHQSNSIEKGLTRIFKKEQVAEDKGSSDQFGKEMVKKIKDL